MRRRQNAEQDLFAADHLEGPRLLAAASLAPHGSQTHQAALQGSGMSACSSGREHNGSKGNMALHQYLGYITLCTSLPEYGRLADEAALLEAGTLSLSVAYSQFCTTHLTRQSPLSAMRFVYGNQLGSTRRASTVLTSLRGLGVSATLICR